LTAAEVAEANEAKPARRWAAGLVAGSVGVLCFSGTAVATRVAVPVFGAATLTCSRIVIATVLSAVTLLLYRSRWPGRSSVPGLLALGLGIAVGYPLFLAMALEQVPAYYGAVVIGLVPAATAALAAARTRERYPLRFWLACGTGFAAVSAFAITQGGGSLHLADLWLAAAVLSAAIGYVEGGKVARQIGAIPAFCWAMFLLAPAAAIALAVLVPARHLGPISASAWVGFGYVGVVSMFAGSVFWYLGLAAGGTARIGQLNLAQPFLAIIWSALLLGEHITWAVPATAAVVLACMALCVNT
jgi:drug/metabolite transporter (DMT)-like permease